MRVTAINNHEKIFFETGLDNGGKKHILTSTSVEIPGEELSLPYYNCNREDGDKSFYYTEEYTKKNIVLHFTAGYLKGDIATLTKAGNHVSVPFVLPRNGKVLKLWPAKYWSYHLGPGAVGDNKIMSQQTIAIEISNIGFLKRVGDELYSDYANDAMYCTIAETEHYYSLSTPFRDKKYFAKFTNEQYESLIVLLRYLTANYGISRNVLPVTERYNLISENKANQFNGILSHVNFRTDKFDISSAFDWQRIIDGLK